MHPDPTNSVRGLRDRFKGTLEAAEGLEHLNAERLLAIANGTDADPHLQGCPLCTQLLKELRQMLADKGGVATFLAVVREKAARYEKQQGGRLFARITSYFVVTRNGRFAVAAMAACALVLAAMVAWDRMAEPTSTRVIAVFEPEEYTRAITALSGLVNDMRANRIAAPDVQRRVVDINPLLHKAQEQSLTGEQRAEIVSLRWAFDSVKKRYSILQAPQVDAGDSVSGLLQSLDESGPSHEWELVSISLKRENKASADNIVLKGRVSSPVPADDPAVTKLGSYATREATQIRWEDVALFEPGRPPRFLATGLR